MFAQVIDFLKDDAFIHHVLERTPESSSHWENYFVLHPEHTAYAEEARAVLQAPADVACGLSADESLDLKKRILDTLIAKSV